MRKSSPKLLACCIYLTWLPISRISMRPPFTNKSISQQPTMPPIEPQDGFTEITEDDLKKTIENDPKTLLVFRTILGLTREEFAQSTTLAGQPVGLASLTPGKVDSMERHGSATTADQALVAAMTLRLVMDGTLFGKPPAGLRSKQAKPDTAHGWESVQKFATRGVPFATFLHQRHYGGAFRQVLDATSTQRGNLIEEAVQTLFKEHRVPFLRTGNNNQAEIASRFEVRCHTCAGFRRIRQRRLLEGNA